MLHRRSYRVPVSSRRRPSPNQALLTAAVLAALTVSVRSQAQFDQLARRGLPADFDQTLAVAMGDVDGDNDLDIVCGNNFAQNRLYVNDGNGNFTDVTLAQLPQFADSTLALALGDVDDDGDLDLIVGNAYAYPTGPQNRLLLNDGTGTFSDVTTSQMPTDNDTTRSVTLGDVDGDGDLDLVMGNDIVNLGQQNRLYVNDGFGVFTDVTSTQLPVLEDSTNDVVLGDVDGDGDLDLAVGNGFYQIGYGWPYYGPPTAGEQNRLLLNNGLGVFIDVTATNLPVDADWTRAMVFADVDDDNDLDMFSGNRDSILQSPQNRLYVNDGAGLFTYAPAAQLPFANDRTTSMEVGDFDGDGDIDMITGNDFWGGQQNRLFLNDGAGTFTDVSVLRMPVGTSNTNGMAIGDVDGDGDIDLVCGHTGTFLGSAQNTLYFNLLSQIAAPEPYLIGQAYTLEAYRRYGPTTAPDFAVPFVSFAEASIPLPPFGTIGIDPTQAVPMPIVPIPQPAGFGSISLSVPVAPGLIGADIFWQAMMLSGTFEAQFSNVLPDVYAPLAAPNITSLVPPTAGPGTQVTINGDTFLLGVTLTVDSIPVPILTSTPTELTFLAPATIGCDAVVEVANLGNSTASGILNASPSVTSVPFTTGPAVGGGPFSLVGNDLVGVVVSFNGVPMTNITSQTATEVVGFAPPGAPGPATVVVNNAVGCPTTLSYTYDATPQIDSIQPPSAIAGAPVTVVGNNYLAGLTLTVGGSVTPVTSFTPTSVSFVMPAGLGCDTQVSVTNIGSTTVAETMNGTPVIASFPISSGSAAGNAIFIVTGNFLLGTTLTFGGVPVTNITSQSQTVIVGRTPPGAVGPAAVVITNVIGCQATTSYNYF